MQSNSPLELDRRAAEIIALEQAFWEALRDEDIEAALQLARDPCVLMGADGHQVHGRRSLEDLLRSSPDKLEHFEFQDEPAVHFLGQDVAVITYRIFEQLVVEGERLELELVETSTWVLQEGRWRVGVHGEAVRGDPYGRDRVDQPA